MATKCQDLAKIMGQMDGNYLTHREEELVLGMKVKRKFFLCGCS